MDETGQMRVSFADGNYRSRKNTKCFNAEDDICPIVPDTCKAVETARSGTQNNHYFDSIFLFDIFKGMKGSNNLKQLRSLENEYEISLAAELAIIIHFSFVEIAGKLWGARMFANALEFC